MHFKLYIFILIILLSACSKEKNYEQIKVIGHAATGLENLNSVYHDNSKEAVEFALSIEGCDGVEIDLQLSADGKLWLYHDTHLDTETNGENCIANLTSEQLNLLHYKSIHKEELVPLSELNKSLLKGRTIFFDLRHYNNCAEVFISVDQVVAELKNLGYDTQTDFELYCIVGHDPWILPLHQAGFKVVYSIYSQAESINFSQLYPELSGYILRNSDISKDEVSSIKNSGKKVFIFEVRSPKGIKKALKKLPDAILTDDIRTTLIEKY